MTSSTSRTGAIYYQLAGRKDSPIIQHKSRPADMVLIALSAAAGTIALTLTVGLIVYILAAGLPQISWSFLSTVPSALKKTYGILPNIINTLTIVLLTLLIATPLGIGGAIYLSEYAKKGKLVRAIEFATEALAGIPSILYGLFGMVFFGQVCGLRYSILTGAFTLSIMVLPTIVRTTQEALATVPQGYREGAIGLGAGKWHLIRTILIPCCKNGVITAVILSIGRIVGESAALIFTAGIATNLPKAFFSYLTGSGATLTVQLYQYAERGLNSVCFAIAAILVLIVLGINLAIRLLTGARKEKEGKAS
jgi:phosphate transport system permease protein